MRTVLLVRHGETTWNRERRMQGWADSELTERGRAQAAAVAAYLDETFEVDAVRASDLHRTRQTARRVCERLGREAQFEPGWRERDVGDLEGIAYEQFTEQIGDGVVGGNGVAVAVRPPGGESLVDMRKRVDSAWESLLSTTAPETTSLVVTHGGPIRALLGRLKGLDLAASMSEIDQANCGLNEVRLDETGPTIVRENETGFLG